MSSQPKHCRMDWTGLGWRSWGAELGRSKASRVKPEEVKSVYCLLYDSCVVCKACVLNCFSFPCSLNLYILKSCWASFCWFNQSSLTISFRILPSHFQILSLHPKWLYHFKILVINNSYWLNPCSELFPALSHPVFLQSFLPFTQRLFFLPVGVADLQQHLPAVLEGSGRGVGCGGRGRSVPRVLLLPLGGALSPLWWQAPRPRRVLTGRCADGPAWNDTGTHTHRKQINKSIQWKFQT